MHGVLPSLVLPRIDHGNSPTFALAKYLLAEGFARALGLEAKRHNPHTKLPIQEIGLVDRNTA
jgi:hypothetical protein